jgi:hypothetical protein
VLVGRSKFVLEILSLDIPTVSYQWSRPELRKVDCRVSLSTSCDKDNATMQTMNTSLAVLAFLMAKMQVIRSSREFVRSVH